MRLEFGYRSALFRTPDFQKLSFCSRTFKNVRNFKLINSRKSFNKSMMEILTFLHMGTHAIFYLSLCKKALTCINEGRKYLDIKQKLFHLLNIEYEMRCPIPRITEQRHRK